VRKYPERSAGPRWKYLPDLFPDFTEPSLALLFCAGDNYTKHSPVKARYPAKRYDAVPPDPLERVPEDLLFPQGRRIGGVEDDDFL